MNKQRTCLETAIDLVRNLATPPSTLSDILHDAEPADRDIYDKVRKHLEKELMPSRSLADYVGKTIFPMRGKKALEKWAKDVPNLTPVAQRTAGGSLGHLYGVIDQILNTARQTADSTRKLSDDVQLALEALQDSTMAEDDADKVKDFIKAVLSELRFKTHEAKDKIKADELSARLAATNDVLTQQLIGFASSNDQPGAKPNGVCVP
jgi:hypothetical protein